jgi:asparagine synthase (glutamine-hydrolysing)
MFGESGAVGSDVLVRAAASLHHRGPDGRGHWVNPARSVGLGHTRLSILDLEGGTQPLCNED